MDYILENDWEIIPAGGATGRAFFAFKNNEKLFLKRNSSPFLAVLSVEGIVPKLIWTKRLENGDVITAQECLNGRELKAQDMTRKGVAELLKKIHESDPLLTMLSRLGKTPYSAEAMFEDVLHVMDAELLAFDVIEKSLGFLRANLQAMWCRSYTVCHGDVNHNNWLLSDRDKLYLIDWDGATIADPAFDIGPLLYSYIPKAEWASWLAAYGAENTESFRLRMKWYAMAQALLAVGWHKHKDRIDEMDHWIDFLKAIQ